MKLNNPKSVSYILIRIAMGINIMSHGLVRFSKLENFRNWMLDSFKDSILPQWSVFVWGSILPFLEFIVGLFILIGLFTYKSLILGAIIIILLILGSCLIEKWDWAGTQMIYILFFYFLITNIEDNTLYIK